MRSGLAAACAVPRRRSIRWRRRGSSVAVFRLGVLRYNHMTVGRKRPKKQPLRDPLGVGAGEFTLVSRGAKATARLRAANRSVAEGDAKCFPPPRVSGGTRSRGRQPLALAAPLYAPPALQQVKTEFLDFGSPFKIHNQVTVLVV